MSLASTATIRDIRDYLSHGCDGPITRFVLICRALDLVRKGYDADTVANALDDELEAFGYFCADELE